MMCSQLNKRLDSGTGCSERASHLQAVSSGVLLAAMAPSVNTISLTHRGKCSGQLSYYRDFVCPGQAQNLIKSFLYLSLAVLMLAQSFFPVVTV